MTSRSSSFSGIAACALASSASLFVQPADACSPPPASPVELLSNSHLPDGVLVGQLRCHGCSPDDLVFADYQGTPIPGSFVAVDESAPEGTFAWKPDSTLAYTEPDEGHTISLEGFDPETFYTADASDDTPLSHLAQVREHSSSPGQSYECKRPDASFGGSCYYPSYSSSTLVRAAIEIDIEGGQSTQHLSRVEYWVEGSNDVAEVLPFGQPPVYTFEGEPVSVCYALYATLATGGDEFLVGEDCFNTRNLEMGIANSGNGDRENVLDHCVEPGDELRSEWCQWYEAAIRAQSCTGFQEEACNAALVECSVEDLVPAEDDPDVPPATDDEPEGGTDEPDISSPADANETATDGASTASNEKSGCSFGGSVGGSPAHIGLLLTGLLGWAARRRQRTRPRFAGESASRLV